MRLSIALAAAAAVAAAAAPPPPPQILLFSFDSAFGDNMLLQRAPAQSAVYGFLDFNASMAGAVVSVTLTPVGGGAPTTVQATLNATVQTFGPEWGVRSVVPANCPGCLPPFNPWNTPLASWKVLFPPQPAGGNYSVTAVCTGCSALGPSTITLANVTFGDMWYCTGQVSFLYGVPAPRARPAPAVAASRAARRPAPRPQLQP